MNHHEQLVDVRIGVHEIIADWPFRSPFDCCIYRLQNHLREVSKDAYEPNIIAIGPYHRGLRNYLKLMDEHKQRYLQNLLDRRKQHLKTYVDAIKSLEEKVRNCYAEPLTEYNADQLVEMMVLDGCFIIELVRKFSNSKLREENDPIFRMEWIINSLKRDLLLFENQIPFFIICKLFDMTKAAPDSTETFTGLARMFFIDLLPGDARKDNDDSDISYRFRHLLGLVHNNWLPAFTPSTTKKEDPKEIGCLNMVMPLGLKILREAGLATPPPLHAIEGGTIAMRSESFKYIHCLTDLKEAGIKFVKGKSSNIFDITFEHGTIRIPPFIIEDRTESFFRNLIAHEQYDHQGTDNHFVTDYVRFLDCLINSPKDVGALRRRGIVNNWLGNDEVVANMFNRMTHLVVGPAESFNYNQVFDSVNKYYYKRRHRSMATLKRKYLNTPWAVISLFAAFVLLALTFLQTVFTIKV